MDRLMDDISTWEWVLLVWFLEIGSHRAQTGLEHAGVTQAGLELLVFPPERWGYRHESPQPVTQQILIWS